MERPETIQFGNTGINRAAAIEMGEAAFKAAYRGKLDHDLNDAWLQITGKPASISMTPIDGNVQPRKGSRPQQKPGEAKAEPAKESETDTEVEKK